MICWAMIVRIRKIPLICLPIIQAVIANLVICLVPTHSRHSLLLARRRNVHPSSSNQNSRARAQSLQYRRHRL